MICVACGGRAESRPCGQCDADPALVDPDSGRHYALDAVVGQGAMATTWRGRALSQGGAVVALKEVPLRRATTPKARQLLDREAQVLRQLDHPGIPRLHAVFSTGQGRHRALWLVQEFIDGENLVQWMAHARPSPEEVARICIDLLDILAYLHGRSPPVVHRDVKPANVLRRPDGALALVDFGAVRDALRDSVFGGSTVAGTFGFMAPEQFRGDASPASDLYAVGATAVALLTREEPRALLTGPGQLSWRGRAACPPFLADALDRLLAADPDDRPRSAQDAALLLGAAISSLNSADTPPPGRSASTEPGPRPVLDREPAPMGSDETDFGDFEAPIPRAPGAMEDAGARPTRRAVFALGATMSALMLAAGITWTTLSPAVPVTVEAPVAPPVSTPANPAVGPLWQEYHDVIWRDTKVQGCLDAFEDWPTDARPGDPLVVTIALSPDQAARWSLEAGPWSGHGLEGCLLDALDDVQLQRKDAAVEQPVTLELPWYPQRERLPERPYHPNQPGIPDSPDDPNARR